MNSVSGRKKIVSPTMESVTRSTDSGRDNGTDNGTDMTYHWRRSLEDPSGPRGEINPVSASFVRANCCQSNLFPAGKSCFRHHIIPIFGGADFASHGKRQLTRARGRGRHSSSGWCRDPAGRYRLVPCRIHNTFLSTSWGRGWGWGYMIIPPSSSTALHWPHLVCSRLFLSMFVPRPGRRCFLALSSTGRSFSASAQRALGDN